MSEMKKMNPEQMEEVSGGIDCKRVVNGRLTPVQTQVLTMIMKDAKKRGVTMETYLKGADSLRNTHCFKDETECNE